MLFRSEWTESLFGLPFLLGSCFLVPTALMTCFGKVEVRVEGRTGTVFTGVGPLGWRRKFRWDAVTEVKFGEASWRQNYKAVRQMFIVAERTLKFGSGINEARQDFICAALKRLKGTVAA